MTTLSRRRFLAMVGGTGAAAVLVSCGVNVTAGQTAELVRSQIRLPDPFRVPLPIPPVKRPTRTDGTTDYYEIGQREASMEILPGLQTPIFGYDGLFPGPTIESRSGRRTVVRHINELSVPIAVHLHGGHTPAASDGYPVDLVLPMNATTHNGMHHGMLGDVSQGHRDYEYPLNQRAATLWYRTTPWTSPARRCIAGLLGSTSCVMTRRRHWHYLAGSGRFR